jgi:hypothetical protein
MTSVRYAGVSAIEGSERRGPSTSACPSGAVRPDLPIGRKALECFPPGGRLRPPGLSRSVGSAGRSAIGGDPGRPAGLRERGSLGRGKRGRRALVTVVRVNRRTAGRNGDPIGQVRPDLPPRRSVPAAAGRTLTDITRPTAGRPALGDVRGDLWTSGSRGGRPDRRSGSVHLAVGVTGRRSAGCFRSESSTAPGGHAESARRGDFPVRPRTCMIGSMSR